ncbi:MAG: hypothetical protein HYR49_03435 [Gammaproteobacteria bacterium]|nr:hypothetical protein [Gammaproteobacteria bacterium]
MNSVYLVNIGANTSHSAKARSPIFANGSFIYVPFPTRRPKPGPGYPAEALPFVRSVGRRCTHADPDWEGLSYGDRCSNPRAASLRSVAVGDILLFWGLLWRNVGADWAGFTRDRGWYLLGALRVEEIAESGQSLQRVSSRNRARAARNAHFLSGHGVAPKDERVFLGAGRYSTRFSRPVDLAVSKPSGLIYRAFTSSGGALLSYGMSPSWRSSLRSCRKIWDLRDRADRARAKLVRDAILRSDGFDLLKDHSV